MKNPIYLINRLKERLSGEHSITLSQAILMVISSKWKRIFYSFTALYGKTKLRLWGASVGKKFKLQGFLVLETYGRIVIGDNVRINSGPLHVGGSDRRTAFRVGRKGVLTLKDGAGMTNSTISCSNSVTIGENVLIGGGCEILDSDGHQTNPFDRNSKKGKIKNSPIVIEKNVFVGGLSIIKHGVTIGEGSVIGTGSLVIKSIPPHEIWAGVPAKFIKKIEKKSPKD